MRKNSVDVLKKSAFSRIETELPELLAIRDRLYREPEIGGTEKTASELLIQKLERGKFTVERNYFDVPYAFKAVCSSGKPGAVIGIFAEYDALPDVGHGCGHNLIAATSLGTALALSEVVGETGGAVIVYGTPGEENLQTKTPLTAAGAFDEADVAFMVHPSPITYSSGKTLAIESLQIEFFGESAHAGVSPEKGRNALDAAVQCYHGIHFEKQYYKDTNVYGVINEGGKKASVIPDYASLCFLNRAWSMEELAALRKMVEKCAESAAIMTGCTFKVSNNEQTNQAMLSNRHIADIFDKNLTRLGEKKILKENVKGSTDMADVSWRIPSIHPWVGLDCPDVALHSREFADRTISAYGDVFLEKCCKALAATAIEIMADKELLAAIADEFSQSVKQIVR